MRKFIVSLALIIVAAVPASAQRLNLDFLADLEDRAEEVVDVTLDASMLRMASKFFKGHDSDQQAIGDQVGGQTSVGECPPIRLANRADLAMQDAVTAIDLAARIAEGSRLA